VHSEQEEVIYEAILSSQHKSCESMNRENITEMNVF
jgi:hypothetical protein